MLIARNKKKFETNKNRNKIRMKDCSKSALRVQPRLRSSGVRGVQ